MIRITSMLGRGAASAVAAMCLILGPMASAQDGQVTGRIEWGVWIDPDGCQHWWADGGTEGYMSARRNQTTGKPVCAVPKTCLSENTDAFFDTASATLTGSGRARLEQFFRSSNSYSFIIVGHTDSRGSNEYNQRLSEARARAVGNVARSLGAVVESEVGYGETRPVATNGTAAGMAKNRRVEVICKKG